MNVTVVNPLENDKIDTNRIVDGLITLSKNNKAEGKQYGSIMFESVAISMAGGFVNKTKRIAFLSGVVSDLQEASQALGLEAGKSLENYRIVIKEQVTPFYEGQETKKGKSNPESDEFDKTMTHNGSPIYRKNFLVEELSEDRDVLLTNDTVATAVASAIDEIVAESNTIS